MMMTQSVSRRTFTALCTGVLVLIFLPGFVSPYGLRILNFILMWILWCTSLNITMGMTGMFNMGHVINIGLGAYTSTYLFLNFGISPWIGMIAGCIVAALMAMFITYVAFRYKIAHLAYGLITMGFAFIVMYIISAVPALGEVNGLNIPRKNDPFMFLFGDGVPYYYIILIFAAGTVVLYWIIDRRKLGIYFKAIRENERAAEASGINILKYKLISSIVSAIPAAIGGTFYAQYIGFIDPHSTMGIMLVVQMILFTAVGGFGLLWGPTVACFILIPLGEKLNSILGVEYAGAPQIIYGVIVIAVILLMPDGIVGWLSQRWSLYRCRSVGLFSLPEVSPFKIDKP
jgi:branched-chain amino acid transport system permease protein